MCKRGQTDGRSLLSSLIFNVVAPAVVLAVIAGWRWFTGAPMWGTSGFPVLWPRWQRAVARLIVTALVVAGVWWPWPTLAAVTAVGAVTCLAALETRRRIPGPIRVTATVGPPITQREVQR